MQDIAVKISKATRMIDKDVAVIGNDGESLQTRLVFSFTDEFVNGVARLEYELSDGTKDFIMLTKEEETYSTPITNLIMKSGIVHMQVIINEAGEPIPIFKSNIFRFRINDSLNVITVEPTGYEQWIDIANEKLAEVENVDIRVEKVENVSTITITNRYGEEQQVEVLDGEQGPQGPQGPKGDPGEGSISDVKVNNVSVVENKIANINVPIKTSQLQNNSGFISEELDPTVPSWAKQPNKPIYNYNEIQNTPDLSVYATNQDLNTEITNRQNADTNLQTQIDALSNANDVVDVLATYQDLLNYDTTNLKNNDIVKVMTDSTHQNAISYFKWVIVEQVGSWSYVGSQGPFYTKSETDTLLNTKQNEITASNKLNSNLVDDTNSTNKFVTTSDKTNWNGKEDATNKTTEITSSSTNTQYPGAKAVYDKIGPIEIILDEIIQGALDGDNREY